MNRADRNARDRFRAELWPRVKAELDRLATLGVQADEIPANHFLVARRADTVLVCALNLELRKSEALNLAAWLVAMCDPTEQDKFQDLLEAVLNT